MTDADEDGYGDAYALSDVIGGNDCDDDSSIFWCRRIVGDGVDQDCDFKDFCMKILMGIAMEQRTIPSNDTDCDDEGESGTSDDCDGNDPQSCRSRRDQGMVLIKIAMERMQVEQSLIEPSNPSTEVSDEEAAKSGCICIRSGKSSSFSSSCSGFIPTNLTDSFGDHRKDSCS